MEVMERVHFQHGDRLPTHSVGKPLLVLVRTRDRNRLQRLVGRVGEAREVNHELKAPKKVKDEENWKHKHAAHDVGLKRE